MAKDTYRSIVERDEAACDRLFKTCDRFEFPVQGRLENCVVSRELWGWREYARSRRQPKPHGHAHMEQRGD